jgi:tripartite-type tricarboxylate transporter receptor subunit TctC
MHRSRFMIPILAAMFFAVGASTLAHSFPTARITIIVPAEPGGPADLLARHLGSVLGPRIGQPVIVLNKPGAGGYLAGEYTARAAADGYTLYINAFGGLHTNLFVKGRAILSHDLLPIAPVAETPLFLVAPTTLPTKDLREFVAYVRQKPNQLNVGVMIGTSNHLETSSFLQATGLKMVEVPYNGHTSALTAMLRSDIQLYATSDSAPKPLLDAGKIRALAVAAKERFYLEPNVPTAKEQGFDLEASAYYVILGPLNIPPNVVAYLNKNIVEALNSDDSRQTLMKLGFYPVKANPDELRTKLAAETKHFTEAALAAGITPK